MSNEAINWALKQKDVGGPARKLILLLLANHADEDWTCWPSRALLAEEAELQPRMVSRHVEALEAAGLIRRVEWRRDDGGRGANSYALGPAAVTPQKAGRRRGGRVAPEAPPCTGVQGGLVSEYKGSLHSGTRGPGTGVQDIEPSGESQGNPPSEPPVAAAIAAAGADAVASSSANAVAFAAARGRKVKVPKQRQAAAADDPRKQRVTYYKSDLDIEEVNQRVYDAINEMTADDAAALVQDFRRVRPKIAQDCWEAAENQLADAGSDLSPERITRLALKYGVQHYGGSESGWPWFVVPAPERPRTSTASPQAA